MDREARPACGRCWQFLWTLMLLLPSLAATAQDTLCIEGCTCVRFRRSAGTVRVEMECINQGLTRVPDLSDFASNLTRLNLCDNDITELRRDDFKNLQILSELNLCNNKIQSIADETFSRSNLPHLQYLSLANNQLESLPDNVMKDARLQSLDLSFNELTTPPRAIGITAIIGRHLILNNNPFGYLQEDAFAGILQTQSGPNDLDLSYCDLTGFAPTAFENFGALIELHLDGNSISSLTRDHFSHVTTSLLRLFLRHGGISNIEAGTFETFGNLKELHLSGNNFVYLMRNSFRGLLLRMLDLSNCGITDIGRGSLRVRVSKTLRLENNNITIIHSRDFLDLWGVQELFLSSNNIQQINGHPFENITELGELYLDHNSLDDKSVTGALRNHSRLYYLDLSSNNLTCVPNLNSSNFPSLRGLRLSGNQIHYLRREHVKNMTTLRNFNIKANGLREIEEDAFEELSSLTSLDIEQSELTHLPSLQPLRYLQNLYISHSQLQSLPQDLCESAPRLMILQAANNEIREIPSLSRCKRLFSVSLAYNHIDNLAEDQFANLPYLEAMDLKRNIIREFPVSIFANSSRLTYLDMSFNKVSKLERDAFLYNFQLQDVLLNDNLIMEIHPNAFPSNMINLDTLNISNNDISTWQLPEGGFPWLRTLSMQNLFRLHQVPEPSQIPSIQNLELTYSYHCCIWSDYNRNFTVAIDESDTEIPLTISLPITIPPEKIHTFDDNPFVSECITHPDNPITEAQRQHIISVAKQFHLTVVVLDNCVVEFLDGDGRPLGNDDDYFFEDAPDILLEPPTLPVLSKIKCIPRCGSVAFKPAVLISLLTVVSAAVFVF